MLQQHDPEEALQYNIGYDYHAQIIRKNMLTYLNETGIRFIRKSAFAVVTIFLTNLHSGGLKKG